MATLIESVAKWVVDLRYDDLPLEVVEKAKRVLLDTIGCALGAVDAMPVRKGRQVISLQGGCPQATLIGIGDKTSCEHAAFLNGMALRYLDYNDYVLSGRPLHPSINIAPALAVAEMQGLTGRDLLLAIVAGYEVELRLRNAATKGLPDGWDYCSTTAQYSSAATAGKLLDLDASRMAHALSIAGSQANTLGEIRNGSLSEWKGTAEPMAARNGTFAALLAQAGMTGPPKILEGKFGYGNMVAGFLEEAVLRHRSGTFEILKSCVKLWPCLVTAQAPIDAALAIRRQDVVQGEIESITVALSDFGYQQQNRLAGAIRTRESADHSIAYIVARALLDGEVRSDHFEREYFLDSEALTLVGRMSFRPDVQLTALYPESLGARIELKLVTGKVFKAEVLYPEGHAKSPADDERLTRKFIGLAKNLGKERVHRLIEIILSIEKNSDLASLLGLIGAVNR